MREITLNLIGGVLLILFLGALCIYVVYRSNKYDISQNEVINTYCGNIVKTEYISGSFWQRGKIVLYFKNNKRIYFDSTIKIPSDNICIDTKRSGIRTVYAQKDK